MLERDKFLSSRELAKRWGISEQTIRTYRCQRPHLLPKHIRFMGRVLYHIDDIEAIEAAWLRGDVKWRRKKS